jgi:peptide/nickel transport system substrate-binding protein
VLEAIYDGPFDQRSYEFQPVILENMPSLENGSAAITPVDVLPGEEVVDVNGELVTLASGAQVFPAGCSDPTCALTYDGKSPLQMDQMSVDFALKPGLLWSDGQPLTSGDSIYSFELASHPDTPTSKYSVDRTAAYTAVDDLHVRWVGIPGYMDPTYPAKFWLPLPRHAWGGISPADLLTSPLASTNPLGWGAYQIDEWVKGDHITLSPNPNYFRKGEGLPAYDKLVYRFTGQNSDASLVALEVGECDILDQTTYLEGKAEGLLNAQADGTLKALFAPGPEWEHLDFGIKPATYDDGTNPAIDRPDFFGDVRTRQAFAMCVDRQFLVDEALSGQSVVPQSYIPPGHPLAQADLKLPDFNPEEGSRLLDEVGWKDADGDPATARTAQGIPNVPDGTPLVLRYSSTNAPLRQRIVYLLPRALNQCGIQITPALTTPEDLFGAGPAGVIFGRNFDLAEFTWESSLRPQCYLYTTRQIPSAANNWIGVNVTGYSSPEFDQACQTALEAVPGSPEALAAHRKAQEIFATDLPVLPLYMAIKAAATRPDVCGYALDPTARSSLWSIEEIQTRDACP